MTNTAVIGQSTSLVSPDPPAAAQSSHASGGLLAVDWLHRNALNAFLAEPDEELVSLATAAATSLGIGSDHARAEARIRLCARMIAVGRAQMQTLELALGEAVSRRDEQGAALLSRTLDGMSKRLHAWVDAHRLSCDARQRSVAVAIGSAEGVTIISER